MRDAALARNAMGASQAITVYGADPNSKWGNLKSRYIDLLIEVGETVLPMVAKAVGGLVSVLQKAQTFAHNFPTVTKALVGGFIALAGVMAVGGAATLIAAGFKALGLALTFGRTAGLGVKLMEVATGLNSLSTSYARSAAMNLGKG
jgi:hypothetical protein